MNILIEIINGFSVMATNRGTQTELVEIQRSAAANIVGINSMSIDTVFLTVIYAVLLIAAAVSAIKFKKGFIAAGAANLVFSSLWLIVYSSCIVGFIGRYYQYPSYVSFLISIGIKILLGIASFALTVIFLAVQKSRTAGKQAQSA